MRQASRSGLVGAFAAALCVSSAAAIERAGELIVDVDAAAYDPSVGVWSNAGTYTNFTAVGNPGLLTIGNAPAVTFDGASAFVGSDAAPDSITGFEHRSIEAWVFNPTIAPEETVVSWGKRGGPEGSNMAFNYGNNGQFGAVGHWGGGTYDLGWVDNDFTDGAPEAYQWHHLVYTYDEETTRVYSDGVLQNSEDTFALYGDLDTHFDTAIAIASQWEGTATIDTVGDPAFLTGGLKGTLGIGRLRIHSDVLSDAQILSNFDEEKELYSVNPDPPMIGTPDPVPRPLTAAPIHRYSFNNPEAFDATGMEITDSIGGAHGVVVGGFGDLPEYTGTQLRLPGGLSADAPYGDLPNGLISGLAATTIETWVTIEGSHTWSRIFDFGSNSPGGDDGELTEPGDDNGGNTEGLDYLFLSAQRGDDTNLHRVELRDEDPAGGGITTVDATIEKELPADVHFAVVYDPEGFEELDFLLNPSGTFTPGLKLYADGKLVAEGPTNLALSNINDVNNWLGRSNWTNDANFEGSFDEFRIYDYALSPDEVLGSAEAGPNELIIVEIVPGDCNGDGVVDAADLACVQTVEERDAVLAAIPTLAGDLDGNGQVAFPDFLTLSNNFGQALKDYTKGDVDLNGTIAFPDFLTLSNNFGKTAAVAAEVPEPSGIVIACLLGLGMSHWGRRKRCS